VKDNELVSIKNKAEDTGGDENGAKVREVTRIVNRQTKGSGRNRNTPERASGHCCPIAVGENVVDGAGWHGVLVVKGRIQEIAIDGCLCA